jgi:hypothetical protein
MRRKTEPVWFPDRLPTLRSTLALDLKIFPPVQRQQAGEDQPHLAGDKEHQPLNAAQNLTHGHAEQELDVGLGFLEFAQ